MSYPTKIATCCYCGTRAALVLERGRHELSCSTCGAPLHDMKRLKGADPAPRQPSPRDRPEGPVRYHAGRPQARSAKPTKRRGKRKSALRYFLKEAIDVIEDVFD